MSDSIEGRSGSLTQMEPEMPGLRRGEAPQLGGEPRFRPLAEALMAELGDKARTWVLSHQAAAAGSTGFTGLPAFIAQVAAYQVPLSREWNYPGGFTNYVVACIGEVSMRPATKLAALKALREPKFGLREGMGRAVEDYADRIVQIVNRGWERDLDDAEVLGMAIEMLDRCVFELFPEHIKASHGQKFGDKQARLARSEEVFRKVRTLAALNRDDERVMLAARSFSLKMLELYKDTKWMRGDLGFALDVFGMVSFPDLERFNDEVVLLRVVEELAPHVDLEVPRGTIVTYTPRQALEAIGTAHRDKTEVVEAVEKALQGGGDE